MDEYDGEDDEIWTDLSTLLMVHTRRKPEMLLQTAWSWNDRLQISEMLETTTPETPCDVYCWTIVPEPLAVHAGLDEDEGMITLATSAWPIIPDTEGYTPSRSYFRFSRGMPLFYTELFASIRVPENHMQEKIGWTVYENLARTAIDLAKTYDGIIEDDGKVYSRHRNPVALGELLWENAKRDMERFLDYAAQDDPVLDAERAERRSRFRLV